jgi:hypothetical protein
VRRGTAGGWSLLAAFALALVAGGTSETSVIVSGATLGIALVLVVLLGDARTRSVAVPLLIAGLVGSVVALAIVAAAPGNAARGAGHTPDLRLALAATIQDTRQFVHDWWRFTPAAFLVALLVPAGVAVLDPAPSSRVLGGRFWVAGLLAVLAGLLLVAVALFPSFYALGAPQPGRARIIPQFLIALTTAAGGYAFATLVRQALPRLVGSPLVVGAASITLLGLMVVGPVRSTQQALSRVPTAQAWAARWDAIDVRFRAARREGTSEVTVPPLAMDGMIRGMDFLSRDGSDWLNVCVARYYGLRSVRSD